MIFVWLTEKIILKLQLNNIKCNFFVQETEPKKVENLKIEVEGCKAVCLVKSPGLGTSLAVDDVDLNLLWH